MEIASLRKRLAGIDQSVLEIAEMCESRAPAAMHSRLTSIRRDARRLKSLLQEPSGECCAECLEHLKQAGQQLFDSCFDIDHKDTRAALEVLTADLIALPQAGALRH